MVKGKVSGIIANLITAVAEGPIGQNEICFVEIDNTKLMAEVIKVIGNTAYAQVFESTRGLKVGANVEFTGGMLEVTLGPGILSKNYDGLQNDLDTKSGIFFAKGRIYKAYRRRI